MTKKVDVQKIFTAYENIGDQEKITLDKEEFVWLVEEIKTFDARYQNHKLVREDVQDKMKIALDDYFAAKRERDQIRDKFLKQQELLDHYVPQGAKEKLHLAFKLLKEIEDDDNFHGLEQCDLGEVVLILENKFDLSEQ